MAGGPPLRMKIAPASQCWWPPDPAIFIGAQRRIRATRQRILRCAQNDRLWTLRQPFLSCMAVAKSGGAAGRAIRKQCRAAHPGKGKYIKIYKMNLYIVLNMWNPHQCYFMRAAGEC